MKNKNLNIFKLLTVLIIVFSIMATSAVLASEVSPAYKIETSLSNIEQQRGSILNFDVRVTDSEGAKVTPIVTLNGQEMKPAWDDASKTSYRLKFETAGENIIIISVGDASKTVTVNYVPVKPGDVIGKAAISVEVFTLGGGYLVDPVIADIAEGENAAQLLVRVLADNGYAYRNTGTPELAFYLSSITGGRLPIETNIPEALSSALKKREVTISESDKEKGELGEFDYTTMSGWMYCVNGKFPNVGFADYNLADGDVMRVQFTMAYGSDLSGASTMGYDYAEDYYTVADKDELTRLMAEKGIKNVPAEVMAAATKIDSSQADVDGAVNILKTGKVYSDVKNHWAKNSIYYASANNLLQGTGEYEFSPDAYVTRATLVTVLHRMNNKPDAAEAKYEDVSDTHWAASAISWASDKEIVKGISENIFAPDNPITREQLALILYRYAVQSGQSTDTKADLGIFTDSTNVSDWAEEALSWAVGSKIITGRSDNTIDPSGTATRAEIAVILQRYMSLNEK